MTHKLSRHIEKDGFALLSDVISLDLVSELRGRVASLSSCEETLRRGGETFGIRNVAHLIPEAGKWARSHEVRELVEPILGPNARLVRSLFFDKTPAANWNIRWHQDITIAVRKRIIEPKRRSS